MQQKIFSNLLIVSICGILLSTMVFYSIQTILAKSSADETALSQLDDVEKRIDSNNQRLEELIELVKEDNLSRARSLSMLMEMEPDIIKDNAKLEEIATALDVDEIHIIDENGILQWGTQPFKYGTDLAADEQTRPFLDILKDPAIEISQVPTPNASMGVIRQYTGVSLRHTKGIVEIGVISTRLQEGFEEAKIENVLHDVVIGNTGYMFSISMETGLISYHPNPDMVGVRLPKIPIESGFMDVDGRNVRYHTRNTADEILVTAIPTKELYEQRAFSTSFFLIFTIILFILFSIIINTYIKRNVVTGIHDLLGTLDKITDGDLDATAQVRSNAEFNRLSDGINHMLSSIKGMIAEVSEAVTVAEEASKAKSTFLANMSHEIRTPMNAIIGMTELLLNEPLTHRQQDYVNDVNVSSHALLSIINDILDFSKIEAGKIELNLVNYDFHILINNIESMFRFMAREKGLEFRMEKVGEIPKCLYGDDGKLRQILTNICGNAIKYTSNGYLQLKITAINETLTFEIRDTGMGIRKEDLPKLFDAFVQADTQKNRNMNGTGLGLAISRSFAKMMGGDITVDSVYGKGTTFTITIPLMIGDENAIQYEETKEKAESFIAPNAKVLVVDDNELNLKVAMGLLNMFHIHAHTALSGKDAIAEVKENDYDIVFMDHMMPEMDGVEATKEIRGLGGKYERLTIVALTANAVKGAKEMFISVGFNDFLSKPIETDELIGILLTWLPPEKIQKDKVETSISGNKNKTDESKNKDGFLNSIKKIDGININIGLSRISGMEDLYRETIEIFYKKLIVECKKMERYLNDKDLHNLAISVHGMKSSLSTIGAMELSEAAYRLEMASKNEELSYCNENLRGFINNLRSLHRQLSLIVIKEETKPFRPEGTIEYLRENTMAALAAADDFDGDLTSEVIGKIQEYDYGTNVNALLNKAYDAIQDFDYETTMDFLNQVREVMGF